MKEQKRINVTLPSLGKINVNFYCSSAEICDLYYKRDEFNRQKNIKHLGLISTVFEGASHSRYEYLMLQAGLSDIFDNLHKGSTTASQGNIKVGGVNYLGNGLLKSWFLLSNFGHAKNTIGDEKVLLLLSLRNRGFLSQLISPIKDNDLREWSLEKIENFQYTDFHHILSIRRVYKELPRQLERKERIINLYKLLLLDYEKINLKVNRLKLDQLKRIYKTIRSLSIVEIDGLHSHIPISVDLTSIILSLDSIENSYRNTYLIDSLKPILSKMYDDIYLDKDVLATQRDYELKCFDYIHKQPKTSASYEKLIIKALQEGISPLGKSKLTSFARLSITKKMQPDTKFYDEVRNIQTVKRGCKGVDSSLDENKITFVRYADFFIDKEIFSICNLPRLVFNISNLIQDQINHLAENSNFSLYRLMREFRENSVKFGVEDEVINNIIKDTKYTIALNVYESFKTDIFPAFRDLLWSILTFFIKGNFIIDINSENKPYDIFTMKFPGDSFSLIRENIEKAIAHENNDVDRVHELQQLKLSACRKYEGYVFVCLSRVTIFNPEKPPSERLVTDIDSTVIKVRKDELILELHESKNYKKNPEGAAVKDIREKLIPTLNANAKGYRVKKVNRMGAKCVIKCNAN